MPILTPQNRSPLARGSLKALLTASLAAAIMMPMTASATDKQTVTAKAHGEKISVSVPMAMLQTEDGTARLYSALQRKAEKSCKTTIRMKVNSSLPIKPCAAELLDGFVAALDDAGMTALHAASV